MKDENKPNIEKICRDSDYCPAKCNPYYPVYVCLKWLEYPCKARKYDYKIEEYICDLPPKVRDSK